jgi:uncharacterized protein YbjT (DUF2867 family)
VSERLVQRPALPFRHDLAGIDHLIAAAGAGAPPLLYISIVGADQVPVGYNQPKFAVER